MNKKAQIWNIFLVVGGLIGLLLLSVFMMVGWSTVKTATDEIFPEFNSIGEVSPGVNISEYAEMTTTPLNTIVQNFGLIIGFIYILGLVGLMSLAFVFRGNHNGWVIALFFVSVILLVVVCIMVSQSYEEFYLSQDIMGETLRSATLPSYLIIYSPVVMCIISFLAGIVMFTGSKDGGFGV